MTKLLKMAYSGVAPLSDCEQDAIAALILDALADDAHWAKQFARSQEILGKMAMEAIAEHKAGKTLPLDPNAL